MRIEHRNNVAELTAFTVFREGVGLPDAVGCHSAIQAKSVKLPIVFVELAGCRRRVVGIVICVCGLGELGLFAFLHFSLLALPLGASGRFALLCFADPLLLQLLSFESLFLLDALSLEPFLEFDTLLFDTLLLETLSLDALLLETLLFETALLLLLALLFHAHSFEPFGFEALLFQSLGCEALLLESFRLYALLLESCSLDTFPLQPLCLETLGLEAFLLQALLFQTLLLSPLHLESLLLLPFEFLLLQQPLLFQSLGFGSLRFEFQVAKEARALIVEFTDKSQFPNPALGAQLARWTP
ncbi:uncharacterized protein LOC62_01G001239 [Vanrija pseudolonga]|uniref:Uncharacterized protein n=1 Tax=Vanrija pseudolonga TaxID=143232 RepID=A0AAF0Y4Q4_9TREE|nr:hypothetical protein LOC62_01G001239 [Vanrija pseudolonga]